MSAHVATPAEVMELRDSIDYVLLDIDGVVWSGDVVIPRIPETLEYLRSQGKEIRFISNNLVYSREVIASQFAGKGIHHVTKADIYNVAYATALYLQERFAGSTDKLVEGNVFVVGAPGLHEEIREVLAPGYTTYGLELNNMPYRPDTAADAWATPLLPTPSDPRVAADYKGRTVSLQEMRFVAVAVGLDFDLNMMKLGCATAVLQRTSAAYVGTNPDPSDPAGHERMLLPASGAVLAAVTTSLGRPPDVMCGKPSPTMGHVLFEKEAQDGHLVNPQRSLMVGDRLMTDILFGRAIGARTALVLSGAQKLAEVQAVKANSTGREREIPDFILHSLADFLPTDGVAPAA